MTEKITDILQEAVDKLEAREARLVELIGPAQNELHDVRKAIKRLKGGGSRRNGTKQEPSPESANVSQAIVDWLDAQPEDAGPFTPKEIAKGAGVSARGLHFKLNGLKKDGRVAEPDEGEWLSRKHPQFDPHRTSPE